MLRPDAPPAVKRRVWTTAPLDVRPRAVEGARTLDTLTDGRRVGVTGRRLAGFAEIIEDGQSRWVHAKYLSTTKPKPPAPAEVAPAQMGLASTPCAGTSGVESGLTPNAVRVYRAVCHNFPQITTYGGLSNHGEHTSGKAIDIMTSDVGTGTAIAEFLRAHAGELGLYDIIWRQQIFTPERGSEGWRGMPDRGSATANHYDHVHVSVY